MSPELKRHFKTATAIYECILELESIKIKNNTAILYWIENFKIMYPSPQEAFDGDPKELKQFLDELIS